MARLTAVPELAESWDGLDLPPPLPELAAGAGAQRGAQVDLFVAHQAGAQPPVGRQAQAVALEAEVITHRRDESDGALCSRQSVVAGRTAARQRRTWL